MKKRDLLLGLALFAGYSAQAVSSPYAGSVAGEGVYYLYQVETGQWLDINHKDIGLWTTHAELDNIGFDVELKKPEGFEGFQIFCNYTGNGSLNGTDQARFYLDQGHRVATDWIFEPVTVAGVENAYKIMAKATPEGTEEQNAIAADIYIGAADGELSDAPTDMTWQLVSRDERLRKMQEDVANGPVDASWLIPWQLMDRNNMRDRGWVRNTINEHGGGDGFNGPRGYPVKEFWHMITTRFSYTLTDLPEGTYGFAVQAYYRDTAAPDNEDNMEAGKQLVERYLNGTENLRATYFAGSETGTVMSIFADAPSEAQDGFTLEIPEAGKWLPNSMDDAGRAMFNGAYANKLIEVGVADGQLTIGFEKKEADYRDWLIVGRFYLSYMSKDVKGENLKPLQDELSKLIETATALPQTPGLINAIAEANKQLSEAKSSTALLAAIDAIQGAVNGVQQSKNAINYFMATKAITDAKGIDTAAASELFNTAISRDDYNNALKQIRFAHRRDAAERHEDVFKGNEAAEGEFYLYNIGQKQFLQGGSDWGAHASLGMPGVLLKLEPEITDGDIKSFYINTGLRNGEDNGRPKEYLGYRGYMDCAPNDDFGFKPVEGKENVYYIVQYDYPDVYMAWNPNASVDQHNGDETTVGTENRNLDPNDLNAQWKLVSKADRDALIEKASIDNPVDVSYYIQSPNFSQRESAAEKWIFTGASIWEPGANHNDFCAEAWNNTDAEISQNVEGLPEGIYSVWCTGLYRNGDHASQTIKETEGEGDNATEVEKFIPGQPDNEQVSYAYLLAGDDSADDKALPNICTESGKAPGEGADVTAKDGTVYHYPQYCDQASNFFRTGLYRTYTVINKEHADALFLAASKQEAQLEKDWMVVDNFRVVYYGKETTKEAVAAKLDASSGVESVVTDEAVEVKDNRIFNLQGIQVANPTQPGIYIQNGKKFVVR